MKKSLIFAASAVLALASGAAAWRPTLDETTAQAVVDDAFGRSVGGRVLTYQTLDLSVTKGAFAAGKDVVSVWAGAPSCLKTWLSSPTDYPGGGSRPASVTVYGQADFAYWAAVAAHDHFEFMSARDAVTLAQGSLPNGRLRAEVKLVGLKDQHLRDAYTVVILGKDGKPIRPEKSNFLDDWKQDGAGWSGSMAYTFDATSAGLDPSGPLALLFRTEAKQDCAYRVNLDLSSFK